MIFDSLKSAKTYLESLLNHKVTFQSSPAKWSSIEELFCTAGITKPPEIIMLGLS